jgi:hypothetical protein
MSERDIVALFWFGLALVILGWSGAVSDTIEIIRRHLRRR